MLFRSEGNPYDGAKTYKVVLPPNIPAEAFWSFTVYDNQTRSMLQTPQNYPRAGSQAFPSPAAQASPDGSTTVWFGPTQPKDVPRGNWIQTTPGVAGVVPSAPNISNRQVLGVSNNGEDLGTITFNVPSKTAQEYYYNLPDFATPVDLVTNLTYDQLQGQSLNNIIATYGGIDGVTALQGRSLIFINTLPGTPNPADDRQLWRIDYTSFEGAYYLNVVKIADIPSEQKFTILYGDVYAITGWYKTPAGRFAQIPLLTAALDTLYYQDGTDPGIFGTIKLIDQIGRAHV